MAKKMITESGSMVWMSPNMEMSTSGGGVGKMFSKAFSGENLFQNIYTANGKGLIAFGSSFPGKILPLEISAGKEFVLQKSAFLASEAGVELSIHFNKKLGAGFFGGEGFILQELRGNGMAFLEVDGDAIEMDLAPGEVIKIDTGNLVGFENSVRYEVETVKGFGNVFFGGEGLFLTKLTGPGKIVLQTMNMNEFALRVGSYIPTSTN